MISFSEKWKYIAVKKKKKKKEWKNIKRARTLNKKEIILLLAAFSFGK